MDAIRDRRHRHLVDRDAFERALPHLTGHFAVQLAHPVRIGRLLDGQDCHAERLALVLGVLTPQGKQLVHRYADRAIALNEGRVVFDGHPTDIDDAMFREIYGQDAERVG